MDPSLREIRKNALLCLNEIVINSELFSAEERMNAARTIIACVGSPTPADFTVDELSTMVDRAPALIALKDDASVEEDA